MSCFLPLHLLGGFLLPFGIWATCVSGWHSPGPWLGALGVVILGMSEYWRRADYDFDHAEEK